MGTDAGTLTISVFQAIAAASVILGAIVGAVVWAMTSFATKAQHQENHAYFQARYNDHETRLRDQESKWSEVNGHLQYIRGKLEPK
jgi:hypothetical protein